MWGRSGHPAAATPQPHLAGRFGSRLQVPLGHPVVNLTSVSPTMTQGCLLVDLQGYLWNVTPSGGPCRSR